MELTKELREEYVQLYETIKVDTSSVVETTRKIMANKAKYEIVSGYTKVPWYVIGVIHALEADFDFETNLFGGQRWDQDDSWVAKNGALKSWDEAAVVALDRINRELDFEAWYIPEICYAFESRNGWSYRDSDASSPHLWGGSNHCSDTDITGAMSLIKNLVPELDPTRVEHKIEKEREKNISEKIKDFLWASDRT